MKLTGPNNPNAAARRCHAYSVVEVMFAVGLVGFVFAAVLAGYAVAFDLLESARENLRATQIVQEKLETIRLYNWDQINTPGFIPETFVASANPTNSSAGPFFNGRITITNAPVSESYSANLREVIIELSWNSGQSQHHRRMATLVSRYGLQNYVY